MLLSKCSGCDLWALVLKVFQQFWQTLLKILKVWSHWNKNLLKILKPAALKSENQDFTRYAIYIANSGRNLTNSALRTGLLSRSYYSTAQAPELQLLYKHWCTYFQPRGVCEFCTLPECFTLPDKIIIICCVVEDSRYLCSSAALSEAGQRRNVILGGGNPPTG